MTHITVCHKSACVQCIATERALADRGIAYDTVDLEQDREMYDRVTAAGHRAAPVVLVDGEIAWFGFRPDLISALAKAGARASAAVADVTADDPESHP